MQSNSARDRDSSDTVRTSSTYSWMSVKGTIPGLATAIPSAIVVSEVSATGWLAARIPGSRQLLRLDTDDAVSAAGTDRHRDAGQQPATTGWDEDRPRLRTLVQDLSPPSLAGHDVRMVEGWMNITSVDSANSGPPPTPSRWLLKRTSMLDAWVAATAGNGAPTGINTVDFAPTRLAASDALRVVSSAGGDTRPLLPSELKAGRMPCES
jgi:hypothetical protein